MTTLPTSLRWQCRIQCHFVINATGTTVAQTSHGMSPAPGISSPRRVYRRRYAFVLDVLYWRTIGRNYVSAGQCGLSTRLCSRLMTRRRWLSVRRVSPIVSTQVWVHVLVQLGATAGTTQYRIKFWQVDDDNNQVHARQSSMIISSITTSGDDPVFPHNASLSRLPGRGAMR